MEGKTEQSDTQPRKNTRRKCLSRLFVFSTVAGILAAVIGVYNSPDCLGLWSMSSENIHDISLHAQILFKQHDKNADGYLTLEEFESLASRINEENFTYDDRIDEKDEVLTVTAMLQPLKQDTMTKDFDAMFATNANSLEGLMNWKAAAKDWQNFGASQFRAFLPDNTELLTLCDPYSLITTVDIRGASLPSNRYLPPLLYTPGEILLHRLLTLLHPRPFVYSRFAPQGARACVRAFSQRHVEVVFRIHAEFQLNLPPQFPFWFTPAQFTGHLVMDRTTDRVIDFHMWVPTDKRLNVDMEWLNGPQETENMEVDIGYMPQMELKSAGPSQPAISKGKDLRDLLLEDRVGETQQLSDIHWDQEMSLQAALRKLEIDFYPFKQVEYLNFTDVWPAALASHKPVHSILLWGALDDQSC